MRYIARFFGWIFSWVALGAIIAFFLFVAVIDYFSKNLPDTAQLAQYTPPTVSRVYNGEGLVLDEFAHEKRLFTPPDEIPDLVKHAFISAEDKNFYTHAGYDVRGMAGAVLEAIRGEGERGASTIPQQVAKNFLLSGEQTVERKVREVIIANKLVSELDRDHILGLYLNEIFLGQNSYGVTAAARTYFAKPLERLNTEEAAYLAAIPKAPSNYHPVRDYDQAIARRDFVLKEMFENGYIDEAEYDRAKAERLKTVQNGDLASYKKSLPPRDYFTDEIRRQLTAEFGKDELFSEGLSVRATIDHKLQERARFALRRALENYDRSRGRFNGAIAEVDLEALDKNWAEALENTKLPRDIAGWYPAVILEAGKDAAHIGIEGKGEANLSFADVAWAAYRGEDGKWRKPNGADDLFDRGDAIYVKEREDGWSYRQIPTVSGAFAAIDPRNGRVLAVVGGFSYEHSNFNRATQALRQPGSAFKPFVYAAALDVGYMPNAVIVDAPIVINTPQGLWRPQNASNRFYGPTPMMTGLEQSRNLMTIRLAKDVGMNVVADYGERYGVYDDMQPVLANALGSQETTLYRMIAAYSTFANGGKSITPTVVDRVQDRFGKTIYAHDERNCIGCVGTDSTSDEPPKIMSRQRQVMDPITSFQITTMLQSVVKNGTAKKTVGKLGMPIAGKTGTTNDSKDVWFIGYTPKIVAGCYIGYDHPTPLGRSVTGGGTCGPVFVNFITEAMKSYGGFDRPTPSGGYFVKLDRFTGKRLPDDAGGKNVIAMFFRDTTVPDVGAGGVGDGNVGGNVIDGGFAMGEDLKLFKPGEDENTPIRKEEVKVKVGNKVKAVPKNPSFGAISSGGLY